MQRIVTDRSLARHHRHLIEVVLAVVLVVALCVVAAVAAQRSMRQQGAENLRQSILDASMQCCAIEGSYAPSLSYLEENYGLVVNTQDYNVTYEVFAENVAPSVTVEVVGE